MGRLLMVIGFCSLISTVLFFKLSNLLCKDTNVRIIFKGARGSFPLISKFSRFLDLKLFLFFHAECFSLLFILKISKNSERTFEFEKRIFWSKSVIILNSSLKSFCFSELFGENNKFLELERTVEQNNYETLIPDECLTLRNKKLRRFQTWEYTLTRVQQCRALSIEHGSIFVIKIFVH